MDMPSLSANPLLPWALGLAVGFPLVMVALGEFSSRAERHGWPSAKVLAGIRRVVIPSLALILFLRHVVDMPADNTGLRLIKTLFWIAVLYQSLAYVNQVVFGAARAGTWQSRVPSLVRDMARFTLVAIGAGLIYSEVWGEEISAAWAALGLGSVVIGLALQEPLGNTVSGLILLAERPLALGDYITAEGVTGMVVEINWRSVHILTAELELKIVPSSALYRASFSNLSRPTKARTGSVDLRFSSALPPHRVKSVMLDMIRGVSGILEEPAPSVSVFEYAGDAIVYRLGFTVATPEELTTAGETVLTRAWYAARRSGLDIPGQPPRDEEVERPIDRIREFPLFHLGDTLAAEIGPALSFLPFGAGEALVAERGPLLGLYLVVKGSAELTAKDPSGDVHRFGRLGPGEFFGENAMVAGQASDLTVTALEDTDVVVIEPDALQRLLEQSPRLVHAIGHVLESRRAALHSIRGLKRQLVAPTANAA
jgi:small-conductance mechanosensitive channel